MNGLKQKHITLGITGGISAYRTLSLIRLLKKQGCEVSTVPTRNAFKFVTQLSLEALSQKPCLTEELNPQNGQINHIEQAYRSDLILVAPATCDFIAKLAHGFADSLLLQTILSFKGPVLVAPAMETNMWLNPATHDNVQTLKKRGVHFIGPEKGDLASGRSGLGRMSSVETIFDHTEMLLTVQDFQGKKALITAGPTVEPLDPVRFISNHSSGKMGVNLARALALRGAQVHLVHGPLQVTVPAFKNLKTYSTQTAGSMLDVSLRVSDNLDIAIMCAAVADFKPASPSKTKIKKAGREDLTIYLQKNPDILAYFGKLKPKPFLVGFAAETCNLEENAQSKCLTKNADLICANLVSKDNSPFGSEQNRITLVSKEGVLKQSERSSKEEIAHLVLDTILSQARI